MSNSEIKKYDLIICVIVFTNILFGFIVCA